MDMESMNGHCMPSSFFLFFLAKFLMFFFFWTVNTKLSYVLKWFIIQKQSCDLNGPVLDLIT